MPSLESSRALSVEDLEKSPNPLARHYTRFRVAERLLLTGHSHQAWPDVAFEGQVEAWNDAATHVDEKWPAASEKADRVRRGYAKLLGDRDGTIALAQGTHDLLVKFLSAMPLHERPRLVTTDGEFHSIRRQLDRLAEERWVEVVKVSADPASAVAERLIAATNARTSAVLASSVLYKNAHVVPGLPSVLEHCRRVGAELVVDAYHQLNVRPCSLERDGLREAFFTGGGYKYCQLGEGNAFLRVPPGREHLRPVVTGWFSEFARLSEQVKGGVAYGEGPARWAAATYDPTSNYRAARVFDFFEAEGLTPERLRELYAHQVALLAERFDALDLDPGLITRDRSVPLAEIGGFLALTSPRSAEIAEGLRARGVLIDIRGTTLRLGPAPYLSDAQLKAAIDALAEAARSL
jgi:kynureninase